jgi:uncharacterized membrane protein YfcA
LSRYTNLATRSVFATSLAVMALVSVGAVGAAAWQGGLAWAVALPFALGAVVALLAGRQVAAPWSSLRLQQAFAVICAFVALLLLARGLGFGV